MTKTYISIGLMSGTSMDGIDLAALRTDGENVIEFLGSDFMPYSDDVRTTLRKSLGKTDAPDAEDIITKLHADVVNRFVEKQSLTPDFIGFHGQTIFHDPANSVTKQLGNGQKLANLCGVNVVYDFRSADMKAGGEGAPLLPMYHRALTQDQDYPIAILNLGGVGNVTWISDDQIIACDTGPASALIDDWVKEKAGLTMDEDGKLAQSGAADQIRVDQWLTHPYFSKPAPKSLDRDDFKHCRVDDLSLEDGAATLTAFTVRAAIKTLCKMLTPPKALYVTGGGRHNRAIMDGLSEHLNVHTIEALNLRGDTMEAEGFAWMAVRKFRNLPISLPTTTGCRTPTIGGVIVQPFENVRT